MSKKLFTKEEIIILKQNKGKHNIIKQIQLDKLTTNNLEIILIHNQLRNYMKFYTIMAQIEIEHKEKHQNEGITIYKETRHKIKELSF